MDLPERCRSRTRASISCGASACCNTSTIRRRPSMTSRECCAQVVVRCCWTQTRGPESSPISNPYAARRIPAQVRRAGLALDPDVGSSAFIFSSEILLRTQVLQRAAQDAIGSGRLARDVAEAAVSEVHEAANRGDAFAAITVFGFVARKFDSFAD